MYSFVLLRIKCFSIFQCTIFLWLICFLINSVNGNSVNQEAHLERFNAELNPNEFVRMHKNQIQQQSATKKIENSPNILEQHIPTGKPPKTIENQKYFGKN